MAIVAKAPTTMQMTYSICNLKVTVRQCDIFTQKSMRRVHSTVISGSRVRRSDRLPKRLDVVEDLKEAAGGKRPPQRPLEHVGVGIGRGEVEPKQPVDGL